MSDETPIQFASRLVRCSDDTPEAEVRIRCHAANVIKKLVDQARLRESDNERLKAEVSKLMKLAAPVWPCDEGEQDD